MKILAQYGNFAPKWFREFETYYDMVSCYGSQYMLCYWKLEMRDGSEFKLPTPKPKKENNSRMEVTTIWVI